MGNFTTHCRHLRGLLVALVESISLVYLKVSKFSNTAIIWFFSSHLPWLPFFLTKHNLVSRLLSPPSSIIGADYYCSDSIYTWDFIRHYRNCPHNTGLKTGLTIYMSLLIIIFGIYTCCQWMKAKVMCRKFECRKDIHYI